MAITEPDWRTPDPQNILVIDTNRGRVLVELVPEVAPGHVERVRQLAREGVYDGRTFFRVIDRFMAQTGDPKDTGEGATARPNLKALAEDRPASDAVLAAMLLADLGDRESLAAVEALLAGMEGEDRKLVEEAAAKLR